MAQFDEIDPDFHACAQFVGIDQSLAHTGLCFEAPGGLIQTCKLEPPKGITPIARLAWLRDKFDKILYPSSIDAVAIEGYSFGSKFHREKLGELGGVLRLAIHDRQIPCVIAQPSQVKKYVFGAAKAKKANIIKEVYKAWNIDVDDDNEADAVVLCQIACGWFRRVPTLRYRQEVLDKLDVLQPKKVASPSPRIRIRQNILTPGAKRR